LWLEPVRVLRLLPAAGASNPERAWTPQELVQIGIKDSPLFDPGTDFHYSNTNTVLLGLVLEQVTGKPLGELYREWIFEPLGLRSHPSGSERAFYAGSCIRTSENFPSPTLGE
jgi:CubicO group peptidase (beta-lactamase class C family)